MKLTIFRCCGIVAAFFLVPFLAFAQAPDLKALKARAEKGDAEAQYILGELHTNGGSAALNFIEAFHWSGKAAAQGHVKAQYRQAALYFDGQGAQRDLPKATELFKKAAEGLRKLAEKGDADAQMKLGTLHQRGLGVAQDSKEAFKWLKLSAEQKNTDAHRGRGG